MNKQPTREEILERLRLARQPKAKKTPKPIAKQSAKTIQKKADEKKLLANDVTLGDVVTKEKWFMARRKEMYGVCQCGCQQYSSKNDDINFRSSCCHIFPQRLFPSVQFHKLNFVERNFWGGCHTNMDNKSMDLWPKMKDWNDIKEKFFVLSPLLTDKERANKFYKHLSTLVYAN